MGTDTTTIYMITHKERPEYKTETLLVDLGFFRTEAEATAKAIALKDAVVAQTQDKAS